MPETTQRKNPVFNGDQSSTAIYDELDDKYND
jgi:hypothetical protein